jgi:hypothetical protein
MKESDQRPIGFIVSIMPGKAFHRRFHAIGVVEMGFVWGVFLQKRESFTSTDHHVLLFAKYSGIL